MRKEINLFILALLTSILTILAGCSNTSTDAQPIMEMDILQSSGLSDKQTDFYAEVFIAIGKVNATEKTAVAMVILPDLEKYLIDRENYDGSTYEIEVEFPVELVEGEWQITSIDPLDEYIRGELEQILFEQIESIRGIEIDFDPQEVPEQ